MKLATLCYLRRDGQTLMLHRNRKENDMHLGKWNGLGGKLQPGETPEECARREIREESGFEVGLLRYKGFIVFPAFDGIEDWYVFVFTAEEITGEMIDSPEGQLAWIEEDKVFDLPLWDGDYIFMKWLQKPELFSARFIYDKQKLVDYQVLFY